MIKISSIQGNYEQFLVRLIANGQGDHQIKDFKLKWWLENLTKEGFFEND